MPIFINAVDNVIILANYKVMYSTLRVQRQLVRTGEMQALRFALSKRLKGQKTRFVMVVRNPYDRFLSFYREKILKARPAVNPETLEPSDQLQACHRLLMRKLGISESQPIEHALDQVRKIELAKFMEILPEIYMLDGHLRPQHLRKHLCISLLGFRFRYTPATLTILRIESAQDLRTLAAYGIDSTEKMNSTQSEEHPQRALTWRQREMIERLYAKDFEIFGYQTGAGALET